MKRLLIALLATATESLALTTIEVTARFADVPAGIEVPEKPELLAKTKGIEILSAPRVTTTPSQAATIEVTQNVAAPDGSVVPLGITLSITPKLTEKGNIAFSGKATDRFKHSQREGEGLSVLAFVAREFYFKGWTTSGSTVLLTGGSPASAAKKDSPAQGKNRDLVIYLTFKKVTTDTATEKPGNSTGTSNSSGAKAPAKKPTGTKSSTTKSATKKKS